MINVVLFIIFIMIFAALNGCGNKNNESLETNQTKINNIEKEETKTNEEDSIREIPKETPIELPEKQEKEEGDKPQNESKKPIEIDGFIKVDDLDESIVIDLRYASTNNFTGKKVYPENVCVLRKETALKLVKANAEFKKKGYRIKVWDAYRPMYVQKIFWDMVKDNRFVANPKNGGSNHNRGTAVDITLVDDKGKEILMPSDFDDFSSKAYRNSSNENKEVKKNIQILTEVMKKCGFKPLDSEWWHFDDINAKNYKVADIRLEKFLGK